MGGEPNDGAEFEDGAVRGEGETRGTDLSGTLSVLRGAFDLAEPGSEFVIGRYRDTSANLRTQMLRILDRAGLAAWPKLFQNLRATRETELAEEFPIQVVCAWIGNSPAIAAKHYLQVTEDHFVRAVAGVGNGVKKAARNPAQQLHAGARKRGTASGGPKRTPRRLRGVFACFVGLRRS